MDVQDLEQQIRTLALESGVKNSELAVLFDKLSEEFENLEDDELEGDEP